MVASDYGSTDLKDLEAIKPNKKEKRPPTSSLIVVLLQGVMQVGGFTAIIPTATMYVKAVGGSASTAGWLVGITAWGGLPLQLQAKRRVARRRLRRGLRFVPRRGTICKGLRVGAGLEAAPANAPLLCAASVSIILLSTPLTHLFLLR